MSKTEAFKHVPLTRGLVTKVSLQDWDLVSQFKWCAALDKSTGNFYAWRDGGLRLHRFLMNAPKHLEVDHRNRDTLDNRRDNLRLCTRQQNQLNCGPRRNTSSRFKGVSWMRVNRKWRVRFQFNGIQKHLGLFVSEETAARAYDSYAINYFKGTPDEEFLYLNFPNQ